MCVLILTLLLQVPTNFIPRPNRVTPAWSAQGGSPLSLRLDESTPAEVERWRNKRLKRVKANTANRDLNDLRAILNRAVALDIIKEKPIAGRVKRIKVDDTSVRCLALGRGRISW